MIDSKEKYQKVMALEREIYGMNNLSLKSKIKLIFYPNHIWRFQSLMRKVEYYGNTKSKILNYTLFPFYTYFFRRQSVKLGFSIPRNVFGPGLCIVHYGMIIVNGHARIGKNCRIHPGTVIGASGGKPLAPTIGNNVYIGPGSKIFGKVNVPDGCVIGANSVVNKSFDETNIMIAGAPAKKIRSIDSSQLIKYIDKSAAES